MTNSQRNLVLSWLLGLIVILVLVFNANWVVKHWAILQWPSLIIILLLVASSKRQFKLGDGSEQINSAASRYPFIKVWLLVYILFIVLGLIYVSINSYNITEELGYGVALLLFLPVLLPFIIVEQIDKYNERK